LPAGSLLVIRALPTSNAADLKSEAVELISKLAKKANQKNIKPAQNSIF
jgi:hypothetical protein